LVLFLFSFIAKKKKEMNKSKTNSMIIGINICFQKRKCCIKMPATTIAA